MNLKKHLIAAVAVFSLITVFVYTSPPNVSTSTVSSYAKVDQTFNAPIPMSARLAPFPENYSKKRVFISTDIGGGDFDDVQSMIHYLLYADMFDTEGIISSQPHVGSRYWKKILRAYRRDYAALSFHSADYPTPAELKKLYAAGSKSKFPRGASSRGVTKLIKAAMKDDPRPLYVLVWGAGTDLALAIKRKPAIKKRIRPVLIMNWSSPAFNANGDRAAWEFIRRQSNMKTLFMDGMIRGIYITGLRQERKYGNVGFVKKVARSAGNLGKLFYRMSAPIDVNRYGIKMGDTPSVFFVMNGDWSNPGKPSWGGKFCKVSKKQWRGCKSKSIAGYPGAGWIAKHRPHYLRDFERRLQRLKPLN
jgi:hypothetical protein